MPKPNSPRWVVRPRTSWWVYGGGLVVVLLCVSILLYVNLWGKPARDTADVLDLDLPLVIPESADPAAAGPAQSDPDLDEAYWRAVNVQMQDLAARPTVSSTPSVSSTPVSPVELEVITAGASLNVRTAPGTQAPVIGSVAPGTQLRAVAINGAGTWILAHVPHLTEPGWVFAGLVQVVAGNLAALPTVDEDTGAAQTP